jgi:hypothetical protein
MSGQATSSTGGEQSHGGHDLTRRLSEGERAGERGRIMEEMRTTRHMAT